jgi:8-oxo-dGTP pyrophosphatase MutT (NUDIX family)
LTGPGDDRLESSCRRTLTDWRAPNEDQEQLRELYLDHLLSHEHGWARECAGAHLTASSLICAPTQAQVLLVLHARIGRWLQTGGHIEGADASLEAAALREAREESGLDDLRLQPTPLLLSRHLVPCGTVQPTFHLDVQFLVLAPSTAEPVISPESLDVRWFAVDRLPPVDDSVRALVAAADRAW